MIFVLDATIGIGIWLPFTIGKSLALLSVCVHQPLSITPLSNWSFIYSSTRKDCFTFCISLYGRSESSQTQ